MECGVVLESRVGDCVQSFNHTWRSEILAIQDTPVTDPRRTALTTALLGWTHKEILRIRPLCQGNLLLAQVFCYVTMVATGVRPAAHIETDLKTKLQGDLEGISVPEDPTFEDVLTAKTDVYALQIADCSAYDLGIRNDSEAQGGEPLGAVQPTQLASWFAARLAPYDGLAA